MQSTFLGTFSKNVFNSWRFGSLVAGVTLREVAREAGVSVSTVSRVLNDRPFVRSEVRERVLVVTRELGYRPDVAARSMRTGRTGAVALVVSDISNPLFATVAKAADEALSPRGCSLIIANSANDPSHEAELIAALRQRRLDGLVIAVADERAAGLKERLQGFQAVVLLDREIPSARVDCVLSDHATGLSEAVEHLADLGHTRIALIAGTTAQRGSRVRLSTFREEVQRLGLDTDEALCRADELTVDDGYRAVTEILGMKRPPTAIIAGNNQLFAGMFAALRDLRVSIPGQLSVVACEDTELTTFHNPPLDVVRRSLAELGREASELLLARLENPRRRPRRVVLPTTFEPRGSSGPPPASVRTRAFR
jgi:LacI family transcriptional regulator, galactose operon repressor